MSPITGLLCSALLTAASLLSGCATQGVPTSSRTSAEAAVQPALVPFASDLGMARFARSGANVDFAPLANQFEAQYNAAFCGPGSSAIVLNTIQRGSTELPRDHTRLRKDDVQFMPPGADPIVPRYTQDSVIDRGPKTRSQVLGEPVTIAGKQVRDFGYQLHEFDAMLRGNGVVTKVVVVDDALPEQVGGHISPLGAYDSESDSFLLLDVNPATAGWVWMPTSTLVRGMRTFDTVENRGYVLVRGPGR